MGIAAVPRYMGQDFTGAPPGHRFGLYFPYWRDMTWEADSNQKTAALKQVIGLEQGCQQQIKALRQRQAALAECCTPEILILPAISTAPFMTGTGMEHPLENGFAFLNPYGLPYLPGSGVKGVLRRATEELVSSDYGDPEGWNQDAIDALFGRETESGDSETTRNRGALMFWDVIPEPAGNTLRVEIMTPHYGDYYQGNATPHDSGQPNPIPFLAIPPGSSFTFHVQCNPALLPKTLRDSWQILLETAFRHAFEWLGFGSKTAVGYGAMRRSDLPKIPPPKPPTPDNDQKAAPAVGAIKNSGTTTPETGPQRWENVALFWNKGKRELNSTSAQGKAFVGGTEGANLREKLSVEQRSKLDKGKPVTVTLTVERIGGNNWCITDIA